MNIRIPLAKPQVTDLDRDAVLSVLRTPYLSMGPKLAEFEQAICDYTGSKYAVAVNSGTSALQLAIRALRLEPGSEVILPSFTFSAPLNVILQEKLRPKFVDIDPETYNTTPGWVAAAVSPRTRLIVAVHTFGIPVDSRSIREIAKHSVHGKKIHVIEDACEALGATVRGEKAGTLGEAGVFAFYPNKQITTGEGGVLMTQNSRLASQVAQLRSQGRDPQLKWNQHAEVGFSYRISDFNCALGISQLARIEAIIKRRQAVAEMYHRALANVGEIVRPPTTSRVGRISWFVYPVRLASVFAVRDRDWICDSLARKGIATGRYFAPLHRQPVVSHVKAWESRRASSLANTEAVADRVIALPFFNDLTKAQVQEVCGAVEDAIRKLRRKTYRKLPTKGNR